MMLTAGDEFLSGNKNDNSNNLCDERPFLVIEKCLKENRQLEKHSVIQMQPIEIEMGDNHQTENQLTKNGASVLHTPEYSSNPLPLKRPNKCVTAYIPSKAQGQQIDTEDIETHGFVLFKLF